MRLIDFDALGVGRCSKDILPAAYCAGWNGLLNLIENAPTIEAEPVKHGRWIFEDDERMPWCTKAICDYCKTVVANNVHLAVDIGQRKFVEENLYCLNCGAKMDGGNSHVD